MRQGASEDRPRHHGRRTILDGGDVCYLGVHAVEEFDVPVFNLEINLSAVDGVGIDIRSLFIAETVTASGQKNSRQIRVTEESVPSRPS